MRFLLDGEEGGVLPIFSGSDRILNGIFLADDGTVIDGTADTVSVEFYDRPDRKNAATLVKAGAAVVIARGTYTFTLVPAETLLLVPGAVYYLVAKRDVGAGGTDIEIAKKISTIIPK